MDNDSEALLHVDGLELTLGRKHLLAPASFTLHAGRCVALTGPNGSGKTTLLRIVTGKLQPTAGTFRWDGVKNTDLSLALGSTPFYENMTVQEHLGLVAASWSLEESAARPLVEGFGMEPILDSFIEELSSGERQLVSLSLALLRPAKVLILDEPEQRLDTRRRQVLATLLNKQRELGAAVLMASHDTELVEAVADTVLQL
ncbi:ABC transporter ATP-binding protein [Micrococcoides hystricis]|uniref:ATP-binding cassette domain-containing protein n=1 Tax=Micrococcoides hystricis TaxID=1572761 RepID=A0ABV6PAK6_9MICC